MVLLALLEVPTEATAALFRMGGNEDVATEFAVLDESSESGALDFSPDGKQLAVDSSGNGGTDIWDIEQKRIIHHIPEGGAYTWYIELISYSPNGRLFAICHGMRIIDVYETSSWTKVVSIGNKDLGMAQGEGCQAISFTPDGKELIRLAGADLSTPGNNVLFYDVTSWQVTRGIRTIPLGKLNSSQPVNNWSFLITPDMILADPSNNTIFQPNTFSISKDGKYLALAGMSYATHQNETNQAITMVIDLINHALVRIIPGYSESLDWNSDSTMIAGLKSSHGIDIFDPSTGKSVVFEATEPVHILVRYTPDGKYLIEKVGKKVEIWDGQHQKLLQVIKAEPRYIAVSRDGHYFAMGGAKISILDATAMLSLITHPNGPSGKVLVYRLQ